MAAIVSSLPATEASAQDYASQRLQIDISARTLRAAISELSSEIGVSIGTGGSLPDLRTPTVHGRMTVDQALARMLAGTGFTARRVGPTAWRIERAGRTGQRSVPATDPAATVASAASLPPPPPAIILVTAAKTDRDLRDLPVSLSRLDLSAGPLPLSSAGSSAVASGIEGMALTAGGPGRNRMFLRGVADSAFSGESQSTVAIMLDSARITYAAPDPDIRLIDVERVEVLKGPQGSLYGTGALGGIYQIRTNRARINETSFAASGELEGVVHGGIGYGGSAIANLPLVHDAAAVRVVGYAMQEAGWIDSGPRQNGNSVMTSGMRADLGVEPGPEWRVDLSGMMQWINSADSQYVYAEGELRRPAQLPEPHDNDLSHLAFHADGPVGALTLALQSSLTWHEVRDTFDATKGAEGFGVPDPRLLRDDREYRIWDSEVRLSGSLSAIDWLIGVSRIEARQAALVTLESASQPDPAVLDDDRRFSAETALFGNAHLPLGAQFAVEAGARLFSDVVKDTRLVGGQPVSRDLHRSGLTPSASLSWQPRSSRLLFLRYGSASRQGGVDIGPMGMLETFDSDELETLELGFRQQLAGRGQLDIAVFATRWRDMQADMLQPNRLIETMNVGDGQIYGIEASWQQDLGKYWHARAGASYVQAQLVHPTSNLALDDLRLPVVPLYTLRGELMRDVALGEVQGSMGVRLRYSGPSRLSFDPQLDRRMGNVFESALVARFNWHGFDAMVQLENLAGSRADSFAYGNQLRILDGQQFTPVRPTTASISIAHGF